MFDPNTKRPGGVDTSSARQDRDGVAKDRERVDARGIESRPTHGPVFAGLEPPYSGSGNLVPSHSRNCNSSPVVIVTVELNLPTCYYAPDPASIMNANSWE
jgi:hypothetical protein